MTRSQVTTAKPILPPTKPIRRIIAARPAARAKPKAKSPPAAAKNTATADARPRGKLGIILAAIERPAGGALADLVKATGWQAHTVRAALTRLRQRGRDIRLTMADGLKAYRMAG